MGPRDHIVDDNHNWEDTFVSIEPTFAPSNNGESFPQTYPVDPVRLAHPTESFDHHTLSYRHEGENLLLLHGPGKLRQASLQSWKSLRNLQAQVEGGRIRLKKMRILLRLSHKKLDNDLALFLPRLKALDSYYSASKLRELIRECEDIVAARQRLWHAEQDYDKAEEQLNADEWHLRELESTVYGDPLSPLEPEFPTGWLDFTGDEPRRARSNASLASSLSESLPEKDEYDRCLKEVDVWREKLLNLQSEQKQLLRQRAKRNRLGLKLDAFSSNRLEKYEDEHKYLAGGLDRAEASLEYAEVILTRRRSALEQRSQVTDAITEVPLSSHPAEPNTATDYAPDQADHFYERGDVSEASLDHESDLASGVARILQQSNTESPPIFRVPSLYSNAQNVNMARFINQWLLQRVRHCPEETVRLANELASANPALIPEDIVEACLASWLSDGSEKEFFVAVAAGDHSFHESLAPNNGLVEILNDRAASQRLRLSPAGRLSGRLANSDR